MSQQTLINGNRYSFTSIMVAIGGIPQPRVFKSINYDGSQDPGQVQANQVTLVGLTSGYGVGSGSFEMLIAEFDDLAAMLTAGGLVPLASVDFDITVTYSINDIDVRTDELRGVRITKTVVSNSQGNEATAMSCDLVIRRLKLNGVEVFADPLVGGA